MARRPYDPVARRARYAREKANKGGIPPSTARRPVRHEPRSNSVLSKFEALADLLRISPEYLREVMNNADPIGKTPGFALRRPRYAHHEVRRDTVLWRVAEQLGLEPEDVRDAAIEAYQPEIGRVFRVTCRRKKSQ